MRDKYIKDLFKYRSNNEILEALCMSVKLLFDKCPVEANRLWCGFIKKETLITRLKRFFIKKHSLEISLDLVIRNLIADCEINKKTPQYISLPPTFINIIFTKLFKDTQYYTKNKLFIYGLEVVVSNGEIKVY